MGYTVRVDINRNILKQLKIRKPFVWELYEGKEPNIVLWLNGEKKPTVKQLEKAATRFNIPFGYFFLENLPEKRSPIPHYRTINDGTFLPSDNLLDTIETLLKRQQWAEDILLDWGEEKLDFAGSITIDTPINETIRKLKYILDIRNEWAKDIPSWNGAFRYLLEKTENARIFTFINGVVNNNNFRKLDVKEFRGFVLYNGICPFIFINNNDAISGKIFTLVHEIVHILLGKSASFDLRELQPSNNKIELYCNQCTAEFLVPENELKNVFNPGKENYYELARQFKVSSIVIARRLQDLDIITKDKFLKFYYNHIDKDYVVTKTSGGNIYNTLPYRLNSRFIRLLNQAVSNNNILYRDVFKLTGLKPSTYDKLMVRGIKGR